MTAPEAIQRVLATDAEGYRKAKLVRDRLGPLQGGSLVLLKGDQWRGRRELLRPAFGREQVGSAGPLTTQYAAEMVEAWPSDRPVRVDREARNLSLAILAQSLFGLDLRGERTPVHEAADDILARLSPRSVSAYLPDWVPTPRNYRYRRAVSTLHDRIDAVVADASTDSRDDLLSLMLAAGLSPERVRDELIALLFAGYDSTAGDRPEFAYIPYGGGPRHCLGAGLANQTVRLVLAVVLRRRQLELCNELTVTAGPTLSPGAVEVRADRDG